MKLRQKLAAVLDTAMVVTAVPVVTMAETSNKIVKSVSVIKKDDKTTGVALRMKFDDGADANEEFYFELTNAEWLKWDDDEENIDLFAGCEYKYDGKETLLKQHQMMKSGN